MKKRILLLVFGIVSIVNLQAQSLPEEYTFIFEGAPIMGAKSYEARKVESSDSTTIIAFIPCDNTYYLFRKEGGVEYELLYPVGDYVMILSTVKCRIENANYVATQKINQFSFRNPEELQHLEYLLCFLFHVWDRE